MSTPSCNCALSSIGKKAVMALTGLVLVGFILGHLSGNLLFFKGPEVLNAYAQWLHENAALIWTARITLIVSVIAHIIAGISLTLENRAARAGGPAVEQTRRASWGSLTMPYTGLVVLGFIVFHLLHYTFQSVALGGQTFPLASNPAFTDVHAMLVAGFSHSGVSAFYIISLALLSLHLSHGVSSTFQTLGLRNERWRGRLDVLAVAFGWIVFLGFSAIPASVLAGCIK
ncbi:MAG TPA: hypothetical protein DCY41_00830 [Opitutae bacterium]|nr:hypothetical protein [Opitutae bacterium]